jgi:ribosome-associated protein
MSDSTLIINEKVSIPRSEISFRFDTSGGPGGQHANRSATRATLLFDVANSPSLDEETRERLLENLDTHLDKQGVLQISVQDTRSQKKNRDIAESRFMVLMAEALTESKERKETKPPKAAIAKSKAEQKKHSQRKKERRKDWSKEAY